MLHWLPQSPTLGPLIVFWKRWKRSTAHFFFFLVLCFSFLLVAKSLVLHYVNCQLSRKQLLNALTSFGKTWYLRMSNAMCTTGIFPHLELDQLIYLASIMFTWQLFLGQSKFKVEKCKEKFGGTERIPLWKFVLYSYYKLLLIFIVHYSRLHVCIDW